MILTKVTGGSSILNPNIVMEKAQIKEKMRVADFGCGSTGHFIFPAAHIVGPKGTIYAVDILKPALDSIARRAREENLTNVITIWSDLEIYKATKIETESLDAGFLINNLYLSKKRPEMLRETIRMIKRGGKLLVIEWEDTSTPFGPSPENKVKADLLKKAGEKLGLKSEEQFSAGEYHYGLLFSKI